MLRRTIPLLSVFRRACAATALVVVASCTKDDPIGAQPETPVEPPPDPGVALIRQATQYPAMPNERAGLIALRGTAAGTFASGTPYNDLEYTVFDTDYVEGETSGFDTFMPVDPSRAAPGADLIKLVNATSNVDLDGSYANQKGDRIILGTAEHPSPFFLRGSDGLDNDYALITNFDYSAGHIQLRGRAADYGLVRCTTADGCRTDGYYLFYTASPTPDLIAFIFRCDDLAPLISGATPRNVKGLCNTTERLSLADGNQFRFATPINASPSVLGAQFGSSGKEVVGGVTTDAAGNRYVLGLTDGGLEGGTAENSTFIARINADGSRGWTRELTTSNGTLLFDGTTDADFLYAVGRTLSAIPGATSAGGWDAILLKVRLSDGSIVASHQFGNSGLDGYGNVTLDDAGNLYVSGAGSPVGATGTDNSHLVAKHRASDLSPVWRQIVPPQSSGTSLVSEAWGGLTYVPGVVPGQGRLVVGGWFMGAGGGGISANGFLEIWTDLHLAAPARVASAVISSPGVQADWVLDNTVDAAGNIYAAGFTTGTLGALSRGQGDAFIVRFDSNLQNPSYRQVGTARSDAFRKLEIDDNGNLFAVGYTYGDYGTPNADPSGLTGDVIVQRFDRQLNQVASIQFGTANEERAYMHLRGGVVHLGGMTEAALAGPNRGSFDAFVVKVATSTMTVIR